jgi:hypothetical protein
MDTYDEEMYQTTTPTLFDSGFETNGKYFESFCLHNIGLVFLFVSDVLTNIFLENKFISQYLEPI